MYRIIGGVLIAAGILSCSNQHNQITTYYDLENKEIRESFTVRADSPSIREGEYLLYGKEGNLVERRNYAHNLITDTLMKYYASGKVSEKTMFSNGIQDGQRRVFFESGPVMIIEHYSKGTFEGCLSIIL
jgi:antitoxin component YwqK of YwqJK toxin-antitoxin module